MWDLIVSVPDHCLSFYFENITRCREQCPFRVAVISENVTCIRTEQKFIISFIKQFVKHLTLLIKTLAKNSCLKGALCVNF